MNAFDLMWMVSPGLVEGKIGRIVKVALKAIHAIVRYFADAKGFSSDFFLTIVKIKLVKPTTKHPLGMKKILLILSIILLQWGTSDATHMMGGQITVQHVSGMDYLVKYTAYRDTTGIPISPQAFLTFIDSVSNATFNVTIPYDTLVVSLIPGVQEYIYQDTVTFPNPGNWYVFYEECCRNWAILNMTNPGSESHHFYSRVEIDSSNSTPVFLNPPIVVAQENVPFYYNPLPFDANGDSIAWSLDVPLSVSGIPVLGYTLPPSDSLVPFNMDPLTGEITFLPNTVGNFQVSVRVKEYRNGVQIGEISRDMQLIVVPSGNRPAIVTVNANLPPFNAKSYDLAPGTGFSLALSITDQDGQQLRVQGAGEPFALATNPATLAVTGAAGFSTATLQWNPNASQVRSQPYILGIRISEDFGPYIFQSDVTISLRVGFSSTGLVEVSVEDGVNILPNPNNGVFQLLYFTQSTAPVQIDLLGLDGKLVTSLNELNVAKGLNTVRVDKPELSKGMYMAVIRQGSAVIGTQRMVIR